MKVNFNKAFKNYRGEDATEDVEAVSKDGKKTIEKKKQMVNDMLAAILYSGHGLVRLGDAEKDNRRKYEAYKLSLRVCSAKGAIDITPEEAIIIKEVAVSLSAGGYGQIVDLIDGKE